MDDTLVRTFEAGEVPEGGFHHAQHVRVAWWYLNRHSLADALARFSEGLRRFAERQNKPNLYHETITVAYVLLINERLAACRDLNWPQFADCNADLLTWRPSILDRYYRPETLSSARAKRTFVMPDRLEGSQCAIRSEP
jgi:hypothetical protein